MMLEGYIGIRSWRVFLICQLRGFKLYSGRYRKFKNSSMVAMGRVADNHAQDRFTGTTKVGR